MKKLNLIFICTYYIVLNSSCSFLVKKMAGIKNPKVESKETIIKHLKKNNVPLENNYVLKGIPDSSIIYNNLFKGLKGEILLFNRHGQKYCYNGTDKCTGKQLRQAYSEFSKFYKPCENDSTTLNTVLSKATSISPSNSFPQSEYYIVLYWSRFSGGRKKIKQDYTWLQSLSSKSELNTSVLFINCDLQNDWGLKNGRRMRLKFKLKSKKSASIEFGKIPYK